MKKSKNVKLIDIKESKATGNATIQLKKIKIKKIEDWQLRSDSTRTLSTDATYYDSEAAHADRKSEKGINKLINSYMSSEIKEESGLVTINREVKVIFY